jgi:uncharacterized protein YecE (DUF72 family)
VKRKISHKCIGRGNLVFAAKRVTSDHARKGVQVCHPEQEQFLSTMDLLGEKLGPLLFQFGYFNKKAFPDLDAFLARLVSFLKTLPSSHRFALEIRNKNWLFPKLADVLRERGIALALIDQAWMPRPAGWFERFPSDDGPITADFTYIRWLGDRKGIERLTKTWDKTILDCREPLQEWVKVCYQTVRRGVSNQYLTVLILREIVPCVTWGWP